MIRNALFIDSLLTYPANLYTIVKYIFHYEISFVIYRYPGNYITFCNHDVVIFQFFWHESCFDESGQNGRLFYHGGKNMKRKGLRHWMQAKRSQKIHQK